MSRHPLDFDYELGDELPPSGGAAAHALLASALALLVFLVAVLVLGGCGSTRESAKAVVMADQSLAAAQDQLEREPMPLDQGSDAMVAWATRAYDRIVAARRLLAPVGARLAVGYPAVELDPGTSVAQAAKDPAAFDQKATAQAQLVVAEADAAGFWDRLGVIATGVLKVAATSALGVTLGGTGAGAAAIALGMKGLALYRHARAAADEAVTYGNEVTDLVNAAGDERARKQLGTIQKTALERQVKRGVWKHIDTAAKAKRPLERKEQA